jgi:hypothetical protein
MTGTINFEFDLFASTQEQQQQQSVGHHQSKAGGFLRVCCGYIYVFISRSTICDTGFSPACIQYPPGGTL